MHSTRWFCVFAIISLAFLTGCRSEPRCLAGSPCIPLREWARDVDPATVRVKLTRYTEDGGVALHLAPGTHARAFHRAALHACSATGGTAPRLVQPHGYSLLLTGIKPAALGGNGPVKMISLWMKPVADGSAYGAEMEAVVSALTGGDGELTLSDASCTASSDHRCYPF